MLHPSFLERPSKFRGNLPCTFLGHPPVRLLMTRRLLRAADPGEYPPNLVVTILG
jgi:hypothetical protein